MRWQTSGDESLGFTIFRFRMYNLQISLYKKGGQQFASAVVGTNALTGINLYRLKLFTLFVLLMAWTFFVRFGFITLQCLL